MNEIFNSEYRSFFNRVSDKFDEYKNKNGKIKGFGNRERIVIGSKKFVPFLNKKFGCNLPNVNE